MVTWLLAKSNSLAVILTSGSGHLNSAPTGAACLKTCSRGWTDTTSLNLFYRGEVRSTATNCRDSDWL